MNVSLGRFFEKFITEEVKTGSYQSASEVVRAGLRLLQRDKERKPQFMVSSPEELEAKIAEGIASLDRGEGIDGEAVFRQLKERSKHRRGRDG
jgi:antitoxin ParD1/3/4